MHMVQVMGCRHWTGDPDGKFTLLRRLRVRCAGLRAVREDFRMEGGEDLRRLYLLEVDRFAAYIFLASAYAGVPLTFIDTGRPRV